MDICTWTLFRRTFGVEGAICVALLGLVMAGSQVHGETLPGAEKGHFAQRIMLSVT